MLHLSQLVVSLADSGNTAKRRSVYLYAHVNNKKLLIGKLHSKKLQRLQFELYVRYYREQHAPLHSYGTTRKGKFHHHVVVPPFVRRCHLHLVHYFHQGGLRRWYNSAWYSERIPSTPYDPLVHRHAFEKLCSKEDLELAKLFVMPSSIFLNDLDKEQPFSEKRYGSVTRVCAIAMEDKAIPKEFQWWMISNSPVTEVKELKEPIRSAESFLDTQFLPYGSENKSETSILFGPKFLASNLYQLCSKEDLELAKILVRPSLIFLNDLDKEQPFSEKRYSDEQKHFVLVHGSCHGAWCWFKLIPLLEAMGHRVSAFDLLASGTNTKPIRSAESYLDTQFLPYGENDAETSILFGPKFLASNLYHLCSKEDLELAKILVRPSSIFLNDLDKEQPFYEKRYGSVTRVCAIAVEDKAIPKEFQLWMISNSPVTEVKELKEVDHMLMLSDPNQVCTYLVDVALRYA
nr:salicylic acid-binding protein 2-like [Tanacetum cinerariifolium]